MSEKSGVTRPRAVESQPFIPGRQNLRESNVLPDYFFVNKRGTSVIIHVIKAF